MGCFLVGCSLNMFMEFKRVLFWSRIPKFSHLTKLTWNRLCMIKISVKLVILARAATQAGQL